MKRNSASCGFPTASVSTPRTTRITLKTVKTLARTMLRVERLVAGASAGGRAASRRAASCSESPVGAGWAAARVSLRPSRLTAPPPPARALPSSPPQVYAGEAALRNTEGGWRERRRVRDHLQRVQGAHARPCGALPRLRHERGRPCGSTEARRLHLDRRRVVGGR